MPRYYVWNVSEEIKQRFGDAYERDGKTFPNDILCSDGRPVLWTQEFAENADGHVENPALRLATQEEVRTGLTVQQIARGVNNGEV